MGLKILNAGPAGLGQLGGSLKKLELSQIFNIFLILFLFLLCAFAAYSLFTVTYVDGINRSKRNIEYYYNVFDGRHIVCVQQKSFRDYEVDVLVSIALGEGYILLSRDVKKDILGNPIVDAMVFK